MVDMRENKFAWPDYVVFLLVLVVSLAIGVFHGCSRRSKKQTTVDYLLGNRQLKWVPVGVSILVTFQSAILYIGIPAEVYTKGTSYLLFHVGMAASVLIAAFYFVPLLHPLKLTSVYEYLELRFQSKLVRIVGSLLGMLNMVLYMGIVIYAPSTAMEAVSGIPVWASILMIGFIATLYTTVGGLRAVIWTDVFQFAIMFSGLLAILIQGFITQGGLKRVWETATVGNRIDHGGFDFNPTTRHTVWSLVIGGTLTWLANIGVNQSNVQRFCSVPTISAAKWAVLTSMPGFVILGILASLVGLIVYSYFVDVGCDPLEKGVIRNPNQLVPLFVTEVFQFLPGFSGLFVASLFSASLSTVSSSVNSIAAMMWEDVLKWKMGYLSERKSTLVVKGFAMFYGLVAMVVALISMRLGGPATQIALSFFGASGGPLLGMFILGSLFSWANWIGASVGGLLGVFTCMWIAIGSFSRSPSPSLPPVPDTACQAWLNHGVTNGNSSYDYMLTMVTTVAAVVANGTEDGERSVLDPLYRLSYLWYSTVGILTVLVVGLTVSFATGPMAAEDINPQLMVPIFDKLCCCMPRKLRRKLHCGVDHGGTRTAQHDQTLRANQSNESGAMLSHHSTDLITVENGAITVVKNGAIPVKDLRDSHACNGVADSAIDDEASTPLNS